MTNLKKFRETQNLTQEKMAHRIGYTLSMYSQVERGHLKASRKFIEKIRKEFPKINIVEIFLTRNSNDVAIKRAD